MQQFYRGDYLMLNFMPSQKPMFEMAQVMTNTFEKIAQANVQFASAISKAYVDACTTCCRLTEETAQQAGKPSATAK